eukprot:CAMPEP_0206225782 /NCGR_PEP_ID=MMETSP0047_2-20121206/7729_1 /ASSEMBLY_ACC=CAM_ASM_000192 /TAXON_ID=195065 /ORGANISM="Chroomonas mesostigmatica_cf, Strain CCMP1168" /LENGTH=93 /DNA_ID=CAMNT_0053648801 /DNA_START=548 /DNA_END=829 /DNA_ORIENTATION=-
MKHAELRHTLPHPQQQIAVRNTSQRHPLQRVLQQWPQNLHIGSAPSLSSLHAAHSFFLHVEQVSSGGNPPILPQQDHSHNRSVHTTSPTQSNL